MAGRIGGEEFAVLLPQTDSLQALIVAERLRVTIATGQFLSKDNAKLEITASLGVVTMSSYEENINVLLLRADNALYQAKEGGRNRVCVWEEGDTKSASG